MLTVATSDGRISWRPVEDGEFQYSSDQSSIVIKCRDADGAEPFMLQLFDANGFVVETLETAYASSTSFGATTSVPEPWNEPLERLYETARRQALNIDQVIDSLMRSLRRKKEEPPF
jgi:hypothetical protein